MDYVTIENVSKRYGTNTVLDDISFQIKKGDRFGLIGPNGAGKSTLIHILTDLIDMDNGSVWLDGQSVQKAPIATKEKIGLVPQELALMENLSAYDNLEFFGSLYGLKGKRLKEAIAKALGMAGLTDRKKEKVKQFSGGMKRRLNIAAAILHDPEFLILDEPTVGIDPQSRNYIFDFIKEMSRQGTTILYTSHYMEEVELLCNTIFILDEGKEIAYGAKEEIKGMITRQNKIDLTVEEATADLTNGVKSIKGVLNVETPVLNKLELLINEKEFQMMTLIRFLDEHGADIKSISVLEPNLEEVFLHLTGKKLRD